jgi:phosphoribosylanthranilate isomerase
LADPQNTKVKICGVTNLHDALLAANAGADFVGVVVEIPCSPRRLTVAQARVVCEGSPRPVAALFFNWDAKRVAAAVEVLRPKVIQLHGQEEPSLVKALKASLDCKIWKALHVPSQKAGKLDVDEVLATAKAYVDAEVDAIVLDTVVGSTGSTKRYGGTGQVGDWDLARELVKAIPTRVFLAGGINPANVQQAIAQVHPYGVDLCSGVEASPGTKDPQKIAALMRAVRAANEESQ